MANVVNKIRISKFFSDVLGAPIKNKRTDWGGSNDKFVFLRTWTDLASGDLVEINNLARKNTKPVGYKNRVNHIKQIMNGKLGYLVVCVNGSSAEKEVRTIKDWNKNEIFPVKEIIFDKETGITYARVGEPVPTVKLIDESGAKVLADLNRPARRKPRRGIGSY